MYPKIYGRFGHQTLHPSASYFRPHQSKSLPASARDSGSEKTFITVSKTHVPLLCLLKISAHSKPFFASRLATMFLSHSNTVSTGLTFFHRAGLLFPMVVSNVTWINNQEVWVKSWSGCALKFRNLSPSHCWGCKSHRRSRWLQDTTKMPEFLQEGNRFLRRNVKNKVCGVCLHKCYNSQVTD